MGKLFCTFQDKQWNFYCSYHRLKSVLNNRHHHRLDKLSEIQRITRKDLVILSKWLAKIVDIACINCPVGKMDDGLSLSVETVLLFFAILFLAFCCGFLRSLKGMFARKPRSNPRLAQRNILVTHIRIPPTPVPLQNETNMSSVFPTEEQLAPPPYSAVSNILPPSYDDAMKQSATARNEHVDVVVPKIEDRF